MIRHLSCTYHRVPALDHVSADIPLSCITALTGSNGSGKSTFLEALAGTVKPVSGTITGLPRNIAFVPQRSRVSDHLPITVRRTVEMGRWVAHRRLRSEDHRIVDTALERLGIADLAARSIGELSGGQRQRVLVAQGLAQQAPLMLFDEPLTATDAHATTLIDAVIREEQSRGTTIILATHDPQQAEMADHIIVLEQGRIKPS